jgi:hypothetical protein
VDAVVLAGPAQPGQSVLEEVGHASAEPSRWLVERLDAVRAIAVLRPRAEWSV